MAQTEVEKLNQKIEASQNTASQYEAQAATATQAYKKALVDGDLETARKYQREAEEHEREATLYRDNAQALEAHRHDAEVADGVPIYEASKREAAQAIEAEKQMIANVTETLRSILDLDQVITQATNTAEQACRRAINAADTAHQDRPTFQRPQFPNIDTRPLDDFGSTIRDRILNAHRSRKAINQLSDYVDRKEAERERRQAEAQRSGQISSRHSAP